MAKITAPSNKYTALDDSEPETDTGSIAESPTDIPDTRKNTTKDAFLSLRGGRSYSRNLDLDLSGDEQTDPQSPDIGPAAEIEIKVITGSVNTSSDLDLLVAALDEDRHPQSRNPDVHQQPSLSANPPLSNYNDFPATEVTANILQGRVAQTNSPDERRRMFKSFSNISNAPVQSRFPVAFCREKNTNQGDNHINSDGDDNSNLIPGAFPRDDAPKSFPIGGSRGTEHHRDHSDLPSPSRADESSDDGLMDADRSAAYTAFREKVALGKKRGRKSASETALATIGNFKIDPKAENRNKRTSIARAATVTGISSSGRGLKRSRSGSSSDEQQVDTSKDGCDDGLPDYLSKRKVSILEQQKRVKRTSADGHFAPPEGYCFPPNFEDVSFSDDDRTNPLPVRPQLSGIKPVRAYEPVSLDPGGLPDLHPAGFGFIPAPISQRLRDYQIQGATFLYSAYVHQRGCILGDDMGLGKTIQVISFLAAIFGKSGDCRDAKRMRKLRRRGGDRFYPRILIVCPGSLMDNWESELNTWGWWEIYRYHGPTEEKAEAMNAAKSGMAEVVITTYTTFTNYADTLNTVEWNAVIADECHIIKSRTSQTTLAMNKVNALCRIGLTGTAIQNDYAELWTLLNWTNPGTFGDVGIWEKFISRPLRLGQAHGASVGQLARARQTAEMLVQNLLPKVFLRRMKRLIRDQLPQKRDRVVFCPMGQDQMKGYNGLVSGRIISHLRSTGDFCHCGSGRKFGWCCGTKVEMDVESDTEVDGGGDRRDNPALSPGGSDEEVDSKKPRRWQTLLFPAIQVLQKAANHSCLLLPSSSDSTERQSIDRSWLKQAFPTRWPELNAQRDNIMFPSTEVFCGKWSILKQLLQLWDSQGDKVLVFSHSVRLLRMLKMFFTAGTSYNVEYLDGSMSYSDRTQAVARFNSRPHPDAFIFLISSRAGGVGLNITSANKVVIMDPNWNPSHDLQTQDRAYRIGQVKDVDVFRLVSVGTIEEIVYARQIYKQQMSQVGYEASVERRYFDGVQKEGDRKGEIFGLYNLLGGCLDQVDAGSTLPASGESKVSGMLRQIVNKTNIAETRAGVMIAELEGMEDVDKELDDDELAIVRLASEGDTNLDAELTDLDLDQNLATRKRPPRAGTEDFDGSSSRERSTPFSLGKSVPSSSTSAVAADPILAILAAAGVEYTHDNSEVIGSSRMEAHLSREAVQQVRKRKRRTGTEKAASSPPRPDTGPADTSTRKRNAPTSETTAGRFSFSIETLAMEDDSDDSRDDDLRPVFSLPSSAPATFSSGTTSRPGTDTGGPQFRPPEDVRCRQFCAMSRFFGFRDSLSFAVAVESGTQPARQAILERFYRALRRGESRFRPPDRIRRRRVDGGEADSGAGGLVRDEDGVRMGPDGGEAELDAGSTTEAETETDIEIEIGAETDADLARLETEPRLCVQLEAEATGLIDQLGEQDDSDGDEL